MPMFRTTEFCPVFDGSVITVRRGSPIDATVSSEASVLPSSTTMTSRSW